MFSETSSSDFIIYGADESELTHQPHLPFKKKNDKNREIHINYDILRKCPEINIF